MVEALLIVGSIIHTSDAHSVVQQ